MLVEQWLAHILLQGLAFFTRATISLVGALLVVSGLEAIHHLSIDEGAIWQLGPFLLVAGRHSLFFLNRVFFFESVIFVAFIG